MWGLKSQRWPFSPMLLPYPCVYSFIFHTAVLFYLFSMCMRVRAVLCEWLCVFFFFFKFFNLFHANYQLSRLILFSFHFIWQKSPEALLEAECWSVLLWNLCRSEDALEKSHFNFVDRFMAARIKLCGRDSCLLPCRTCSPNEIGNADYQRSFYRLMWYKIWSIFIHINHDIYQRLEKRYLLPISLTLRVIRNG